MTPTDPCSSALADPDPEAWRRALQRFATVIPHTRELGLEVLAVAPPEVTMRLPWQPALLGDASRGLAHGGALTMLLDTVCGASVLCGLPSPEVCPTLDLRVDHYRPAVAGQAIMARARVLRVTESMVFTEGTLWQQPQQPIARGIGNFVRLGPRNTPPGFVEALFAEEEGHA